MRQKIEHTFKAKPVLRSYVGEFLDKLRDKYWFKVLVVEDSPDSRNLLKLAMDTLPCSIDYAEDGHKARRMLERNKSYDLVIIDQELPDTTGVKLLESIDRKQQMREDSKPAVPFIVYSGLELRPMSHMMGFKFADFIKKPTNLTAIHDRIEKVLREQSLTRSRNYTGDGQNL